MMQFFSKWIDKATDYIDVRVKLLQLSVVERTATILSYFGFLLIAMLISLLAFLFIGFGMAELFSELVSSRAGGFFLCALMFVLFLLVILGFRRKIFHSFSAIFVQLLTDEEEDLDEEEEKKK